MLFSTTSVSAVLTADTELGHYGRGKFMVQKDSSTRIEHISDNRNADYIVNNPHARVGHNEG